MFTTFQHRQQLLLTQFTLQTQLVSKTTVQRREDRSGAAFATQARDPGAIHKGDLSHDKTDLAEAWYNHRQGCLA
jgi:hypothetical protein